MVNFETNFSKQLFKIIDRRENIKFFDFFLNPINSLNDSSFYDPQHLNSSGAKKFSFILGEVLIKHY